MKFFLFCRQFHDSKICYKEKISYLQKYIWKSNVEKHEKIAQHPFIPRENPIGISVKHQDKTVFKIIPEMIPEFIVPKNLDSCKLKPYVEWSAEEIMTKPLTSEELFSITYLAASEKIGLKERDNFIKTYSHKPLEDEKIVNPAKESIKERVIDKVQTKLKMS